MLIVRIHPPNVTAIVRISSLYLVKIKGRTIFLVKLRAYGGESLGTVWDTEAYD